MTSTLAQGCQESSRNVLLICDLDGTLIDSYLGIREALQVALSAVGIPMAEPPGRWIVGPPLDELLHRAATGGDAATLARARQVFVDVYDRDTCKRATPFEGVNEMLKDLLAQGVRLGLATNKRLAPTTEILTSRDWHSIFTVVEAVDSRPGHPRRKADMLGDILRGHAVRPAAAYYLGDTEADAVAAQEAGIPFILAAWGVASPVGAGEAFVAHSPDAVSRYVSGAAHVHPSAG